MSKTPHTRNVVVSARQNLALGRYDYNNAKPHSLLGTKSQQKRAGRLSNLTVPHPELCGNLGDADNQAARVAASSVISTPSLNLVPSMSFGN